MIPERLVEFLHGPVIIDVGTRNEKLHPTFNRVVGLKVNPDREALTFFVYEPHADQLVRNLHDNGRIALLAGILPSHETYQLKGVFVSLRPTDERDIAIQEIYRDKAVSHYKLVGVPEALFRSMPYKPGLAITFRVEELFVQTPGPGAGQKIDPGTLT
jgi:hypothetical protein